MKSERDFWSRRRAAVEAESDAVRARAEERAVSEVQAELEARPEYEVLAELGLPVPETVCSGDDLRGYMAKAVPEYLRRRALRTLWKSNPVLACLDGLNDYDGDFTNAATDAPGVKTAYQVGKGLKAHLDHLAAMKDAGPLAASEDGDDADDGAADFPGDAAETEDEVPTPDRASSPPSEHEDEGAVPDAPQPRRMAFYFDGESA